MSVRGQWRVVETPDYDMAGSGSYILFAENGGEFALDCLTRLDPWPLRRRCRRVHMGGSDEMEPAKGHGWAEKLNDGSLEGEISLEGGDDIPFIARRSATSSTAC
ncbi:MAG: hypothetical protein ACRD9W_05435 [Terriglobia bacterium]